MCACWRNDPDQRPVFSSLTQLLGNMLEFESHRKYIVFDTCTASMESLSEEGKSGSSDETFGVNSERRE